MSTVIIGTGGGGDENRAAIQEMETASLKWTESQCAEAQAMLRIHARRIRDLTREFNTEAV